LLFFILNSSFVIRNLQALPAFPGAEGWGAETPGGRGGQVLIVTNTNPSGPGSFYTAILTPGPRTIVFQVSGVIKLNTVIKLGAESLSYLTVAGQTSPGGVTITCDNGTPIQNAYTNTRWHDGIFRFIRCRVIRESGGNGGDHAFSFYRAHHFILDHCDFSGGDDECVDFMYTNHVTVQWSTIANSGPGGQRYGILISGTNPDYLLNRLSLHHNLIANHSKRGPEIHWQVWQAMPDSGKVEFSCNVVYNIGQYKSAFWKVDSNSALQLNAIGNYWGTGPLDTRYCPPINAHERVMIYTGDNWWDATLADKQEAIRRTKADPAFDPDTLLNVQYHTPTIVNTPWDFPKITLHTGAETYDTVLARVGAWPRDSMNRRTVNEVKTRTGSLGQCYDPNITSGPPLPADTDMDGMPDFWETGMGFNPNDKSDNNGDHDNDGYTNIEEYINDVALARLCEDYYNPVYPLPDNWSDYDPSCCSYLGIEEGEIPLNVTSGTSVHPNPWQGGNLTIRSASGQGEIYIFDIQGREIARLKAAKTILWNGKGKNGKSIAPGVYLVRHMEKGKLIYAGKIMAAF
jgi:hypothetical protein